MPSVKVNATVHSDGAVVDVLKARPVRLIPTGEAGVVYGSRVFPLYAGNVIDLADESYEKAECASFLNAGREIPYAIAAAASPSRRIDIGPWNVEQNKFGNYLVFDADEDSALLVAELMEEIGLGVIRWDASQRPADDGYYYQWFVRLKFRGTREVAKTKIGEAFAALDAPDERSITSQTQAELNALRDQAASHEQEMVRLVGIVDGLFATVHEWQASHQQMTSKASALEVDLAEVQKSERTLQRHLAVAQRRLEEAESEVAALKAIQDRPVPSQRDVNTEDLRKLEERSNARISRADADLQAAEEGWEEAEENASQQKARVTEIEAELATSVAELSRLKEEKAALESFVAQAQSADAEKEHIRVAASLRRTSSGRTSADGFAKLLLPRLTLHHEALETLVTVKDPSKIFTVLHELNAGDSLPAEVFKGLASKNVRVMEVKRHLHIGDEGRSSDMGRVYYVKHDDGLFVHVHRKQNDAEQEQSVRRFAEWCRERG